MYTKTLKQRIIGLKDLRLNMEKYIRGAESGKSFTVVRRSRPVFRIVPADEWGEEGWKSVLDFRDVDQRGVSVQDVLTTLKKIDGQA